MSSSDPEFQWEGDPLRVAVVGVGHLGTVHARILASHPGAELVGVVDRDAERVGALAEELGCETFASAEALPDDVDAVSVVVSTPAHAAVAVPLLERGVPCLVEKPLADRLEAADEILAAAERGGAAVTVGHVERFQPGMRRVREMGLSPRFIECHRLTAFNLRSAVVGVVHDLMIHDLDLVLDAVDAPVVEFDAAGGRILTEHEDFASVRLVFENGARASLTAGRVSLSPQRRYRMFAPDSYVSLDFTKNYGLVVRKGANWKGDAAALMSLAEDAMAGRVDVLEQGLLEVEELALEGEQRPLQAELDAFLRSVRDGTPPEVSGVAGRRALELADQVVERIRSQAW
ncbi:MAG: Gfo/Idh/MocA family protein [Planctomycetota bacterium]|jgi:predicted dehydrogenase